MSRLAVHRRVPLTCAWVGACVVVGTVLTFVKV